VTHLDIVAWVITAIGSASPALNDRLTLAEVLDSADYVNMAGIAKEELEHGVRDLRSGGLVTVEAQTFALTAAGRRLFNEAWREYQLEYARVKRGSPLLNAARRLGELACVAGSDDWLVSGEEWAVAQATYRSWH
jgi:hypothetical protein